MRSRNSRVTTGFHRLGLFCAVPLFIGATAIFVSAWFSDNGEYKQDSTASPKLMVQLGPKSFGPQHRLVGTYEIDTGPIRTFAFYISTLTVRDAHPISEDIFSAIQNITTFERRRGTIIQAHEQPILVGDFLAQENIDARKNPYSSWKHLTRGFDWERLVWAAATAALAMFLYGIARALGWVIDGFVSQPER